jgi:hypothetical protein
VTVVTNRETQWKLGASPNPGGKPRGGRVALRKVRELRRAAAVAEIVNQGKAPFEGDALALLQSVYRDRRVPLDVRVACANVAVKFERPQLAVQPATIAEQAPLAPDERQRKIDRLSADLGLVLNGTALPPASNGDAPPEEALAPAEELAEKLRLKAAIAPHEMRQRGLVPENAANTVDNPADKHRILRATGSSDSGP